jgi:hypothetical protein
LSIVKTLGPGLEIYEAHIKYGDTLKEIADQLQTHYTTDSKVIAEEEKKKNDIGN